MHPSSPAFAAYLRAAFCVRYRKVSGSEYLHPDALRIAAALVIGYGSGPVWLPREVGASCVTAPAPTGHLPAPPARREWVQRDLLSLQS